MMAKRTSWFDVVKRFFGLDTHSRSEKKERRRRRKWMLVNRPQVKRLAPIAASSQKPTEVVDESEHLQSKNALSVALATAAAAEAAVAAAQVAAEVFKLSNIRPPSLQQKQETIESSNVKEDNHKEAEAIHQCEQKKELQEAAATRIQAAFRGFLARKALRALKGIVKLQAIIRGRAVRRHAMNTLKRLQSIVDIHSQVCTTRSQMVEGTWHYQENFKIKHLRESIKAERNSQRRWDDSLLSKKEADALFSSKREATVKRERIKEYSYNHRRSAESESRKLNGRWRYWLEQWVDTQLAKSKEFEDLDPVLSTNAKPKEDEDRRNLKQRSHPKQHQFEALESPTMVTRRHIRHKKQRSMGDDNFSASPALPTYMAATQSAKAKARSLSSPKLRPGAFDTYSDSYSPYKNRLSLVSSMVSEAPSCGSTKPSGQSQRSPSLKGILGSAKSSRIVKELNID